MTRVGVFAAFVLLMTGVASALAVVLGVAGVPVTPGSIAIAYAALATPPIEAAFSAALIGLVVDALSGASLGVSSFSLLVTLLVSRLGVSLVPSTRDPSAYGFVALFSFSQALLAMVLLALVGQRGAVDVGQAISIAFTDTVVSLAAFPALHGVLVLLHLEERSATLRERLQAR